MAARIAFVLLASVVIFQLLMWQSHASAVRRDAPNSEPSAGQTIDEAVSSFKNSLDDLIKNVQNNELLQNVSASLKSLGEKVQEQSEQLVKKIQDAAKTPSN